jgi:hypothetical protein
MRRHLAGRVKTSLRLLAVGFSGLCLTACLSPAGHLHAGPDQIGPRLDNYGEAVLPLNGTIVVQGDDAVYGVVRDGRRGPINGAAQPRGAVTLTDTLQRALPGVAVVNHGYPSDTAAESANRWADAPVGDLLILCLGYGDLQAKTPPTEYGEALRALIRRGKARGAAVFVILTPPATDPKLSGLNGYRDAARTAAAEMGIDLFDPATALYQAQVKLPKGAEGSADIYRAIARAMVPYIQVVKPRA